MGRRSVTATFCLFLLFTIVSAFPVSAKTKELQKFEGILVIDDPANDGDSFLVELQGNKYRLRLYYVDCPETGKDQSNAVLRRIREQKAYFAVDGAAVVTEFGEKARKALCEKILAQPFTVHTAFANAGGRSAVSRIYAFVTTSDRRDLGQLLVESGLARNVGLRRATPDGVVREEMECRLRDLELAAALKRTGIWSMCDPNRIEELRRQEREDDQKLEEIKREIEKTSEPKFAIDVNKATEEELQQLPGITSVLAARIVEAREQGGFKNLDDMKERMKNIIVSKTFKNISKFITFSEVQDEGKDDPRKGPEEEE